MRTVSYLSRSAYHQRSCRMYLPACVSRASLTLKWLVFDSVFWLFPFVDSATALNISKNFYGRPAYADIIFSSCGFFYLSFFFFFFPRLISAVGDWMSTILPHMVWRQCTFRMHVWNMLRTARWKYRMQKVAKNRHLRTIIQVCRAISWQLRHISIIGKNLLNNNIFSTCPHNMVNVGPLTTEMVR